MTKAEDFLKKVEMVAPKKGPNTKKILKYYINQLKSKFQTREHITIVSVLCSWTTTPEYVPPTSPISGSPCLFLSFWHSLFTVNCFFVIDCHPSFGSLSFNRLNHTKTHLKCKHERKTKKYGKNRRPRGPETALRFISPLNMNAHME